MLTDAKIRNARTETKPMKLTDGNGLFIEIRPTGAKLWRYRYRIAGKENVFAVGQYFNDRAGEHVSLDDARKKRDQARALVKKGIHPSHHRRTERLATQSAAGNTFKAIAEEWIAAKSAHWSETYQSQVAAVLWADVFPAVGNLPIRSVSAAHILEILRSVEKRGAESVAMLIRQWSSAIFRHAIATLRADTDPAQSLRGAIHRPKVVHHRPLTRHEIPKFVAALDVYSGEAVTIAALRLLLLTFVRTTELRNAKWEEFDFERSEWRIPAERMKMREPHVVPLSRQALSILTLLRQSSVSPTNVFPHAFRPNCSMSESTLNRAMSRMGFNGKKGLGFSAHGFRATASTILNESGYRPDVIERQLAHSPRDKVRASYNRAEWLQERKIMMQEWANMLDAMTVDAGKVIPFRAQQDGESSTRA